MFGGLGDAKACAEEQRSIPGLLAGPGPESSPPGRSAHPEAEAVKHPGEAPDIYNVHASPLKRPTLLRRIAGAFSILNLRPLYSLVDSHLPELREVGHEWRAR
jgi:hypothetical protein